MPYRRRRSVSRSRSRSRFRAGRKVRPQPNVYQYAGGRRVASTKYFKANSRNYVRGAAPYSGAFGAPSISMQTGRLPFARGGYYRLPYSESYAISASGTTGTATVANTYVLNGPYDPRFQIGGGQPMQWDQISFMYQKYIVHKAIVTVTFNNPLYDGMLVGFRVRSSANPTLTSGRTIAELMEMDNTRSKWVNNTGSQTRIFKFSLHPWDIAGLTRLQYMTELSYMASVGQNPTLWSCFLEPFALHTVAGEDNTVRANVRIIYYIQFMEGQSVLDV